MTCRASSRTLNAMSSRDGRPWPVSFQRAWQIHGSGNRGDHAAMTGRQGFAGLRLGLLVLALTVGPAAAQDKSATRALKDASRALQADSPAAFLSYFDRRAWEDYARLETYVVALISQNDLASSVQVLESRQEGEDRVLRVDWLVQISPRNGLGKVESRREILSLRLAPSKKRWRIIGLAPVEFFRP